MHITLLDVGESLSSKTCMANSHTACAPVANETEISGNIFDTPCYRKALNWDSSIPFVYRGNRKSFVCNVPGVASGRVPTSAVGHTPASRIPPPPPSFTNNENGPIRVTFTTLGTSVISCWREPPEVTARQLLAAQENEKQSTDGQRPSCDAAVYLD